MRELGSERIRELESEGRKGVEKKNRPEERFFSLCTI